MIGLVSCQETTATKVDLERTKDFNFDWKFTELKDTVTLKNLPLADNAWRDIRLPHDWSVEHSFDKELDGATGYLPGGVGVYQKHFTTEIATKEKSVYVLFDGVYNNAKFWLNGKELGENPYGYSPVYWDLTPYLKEKGQENVLTVYVDRSRYVDGRWYPGSGIYRNVKLVTVDKVHIPIWGTFIKTPEVSKEKATIDLDIKVANQSASESTVTLSTKILDGSGNEVANASSEVKVASGKTQEFKQNFTVTSPKLWHYNTPNMYKAVTTVTVGSNKIDEYTTPFGIRKLEFEVGKGFFLNGENTLIKGVCIHHDGGLVGAAVPEGVWRRRLQTLKDAGVNGIRPSHNPFSQEFLDLCDEMGFLVQDEIFDEWDYAKDKRLNYHDRSDDYISRGYVEHFQKWAKSDLTRSILRDRNHPSVMQWSIGNEIEWTYLHYRFHTGYFPDRNDPQNQQGYWSNNPPKFSPEVIKARYDAEPKGEYILVETAKKLNKWVKELDPTRTTSANLIVPSVSHVSGFADVVDIAGYSYRNNEISWAQKNFPHKQITITECPGNYSDWKAVLDNPGVYSMYMWTGIGYLGEKHGDWPTKGGWSDILNLAGFKVQGWNYFKSIWVDEPHLSFGTITLDASGYKKKNSAQELPENFVAYNWRNSNMHWNYEEGENVVVELSTNLDKVALFLNGKSLGFKELKDSPDRILRWIMPYETGTLEAKGTYNGKEIVKTLETTTEVTGFTVTPDKTSLKADAYDVAHLVVQLVDAKGRPVKTTNKKVTFEIKGAAKLLGVDTGEDDYVQDFQSDNLVTARGRALAIIQSKKVVGPVTVIAKIDGLADQVVTLDIK